MARDSHPHLAPSRPYLPPVAHSTIRPAFPVYPPGPTRPVAAPAAEGWFSRHFSKPAAVKPAMGQAIAKPAKAQPAARPAMAKRAAPAKPAANKMQH